MQIQDYETVDIIFYLCGDCGFLHNSRYNIDKCPYCRSDNWRCFLEKFSEYWDEE